MTTLTFRSLLLIIVLASAAPARGADGFATGPLGPYLLLGGEGIWQGALSGDAYTLANDSDANAATSLFVDPRGGATPYWDISVEVQIGDVPGGMAGLLYGRQEEEPPFYLALVVDTKGTASILQRNPGGLDRLAVFDKAQLIAGGFNTLRIVEGPGAFEVFVNGTRVGMARTDVAGTGAVGIFAGGKGRFTFRNFALAPVPGDGTPMAAAAATAQESGAAEPAAAAPDGAATQPVEATAAAEAQADAPTSLDDVGYSADSAPLTNGPRPQVPLVTLPLPPMRPVEFGG